MATVEQSNVLLAASIPPPAMPLVVEFRNFRRMSTDAVNAVLMWAVT